MRTALKVLTASSDSTARIWDAATQQGIRRTQGTHRPYLVRSVQCWRLEGAHPKCRQDGPHLGRPPLARLRRTQGHTGEVRSAGFSADGSKVLTASYDKTARDCNAATGRRHSPNSARATGEVGTARCSVRTAKVLTTSADSTARIWDTATGKAHSPNSKGHTGPVGPRCSVRGWLEGAHRQ